MRLYSNFKFDSMSQYWLITAFHLLTLIFLVNGCGSDSAEIIVPAEEGYDWPSTERDYWPTEGWREAPMEQHNLDPEKMQKAEDFANRDELSKALLVVRNGYVVYEKYFHGGSVEQSSNTWSVTKSFTSALVGLIWDRQMIESTDQFMRDLMPEYPQFHEIRLHHALTNTTGLSWKEEGPLWVEWIFSEDWVAHALERGQIAEPGEKFYYSSGNSQFLTALVEEKTGQSPGVIAKRDLFDPLGIEFHPLEEPIQYTRWEDYMEPLSQTWRRDPMGIETAGFGLYLTARDMAKFGYLYLNRGRWEDQRILSEDWVKASTSEQVTNIYGRYSYGYQWYITLVAGEPSFLASGYGGQIIGVVPSLDLVVVLKYEAEDPVHPVSGSKHDDMRLFELVVRSVVD